MKPKLLKEIWSLWESMAECGQLSIGKQFSSDYDRLKIVVDAELAKIQKKLDKDKENHKRWLADPKNKAKVAEYQRTNRDRFKVRNLMKSRNGIINI